LETVLLVMTLQGLHAQPSGISCEFPSTGSGDHGIALWLDDRPSLKDQPGLYRVELRMDGDTRVLATAQPVTTTDARDALVVARPAETVVLTLGLRDDGKAALSLRQGVDGKAETRIGTCRGHEQPLRRWLAS
ncbi:MAG: hypothetical protein AAF762_03400, partial [Pseudomonadota bacterium]